MKLLGRENGGELNHLCLLGLFCGLMRFFSRLSTFGFISLHYYCFYEDAYCSMNSRACTGGNVSMWEVGQEHYIDSGWRRLRLGSYNVQWLALSWLKLGIQIKSTRPSFSLILRRSTDSFGCSVSEVRFHKKLCSGLLLNVYRHLLFSLHPCVRVLLVRCRITFLALILKFSFNQVANYFWVKNRN